MFTPRGYPPPRGRWSSGLPVTPVSPVDDASRCQPRVLFFWQVSHKALLPQTLSWATACMCLAHPPPSCPWLDCPRRIVPTLSSGPWRESRSVPCVPRACSSPGCGYTLLLPSPVSNGTDMALECLLLIWQSSSFVTLHAPSPTAPAASLTAGFPPGPWPSSPPHTLPATIILVEFHAHTATIPHLGPQVLSLFGSNEQFPLAQGIVQKKKKNNQNTFLFLSLIAVCSPLPSNDPKANPSSPFQAADKHSFTVFQKQVGICYLLNAVARKI